MLTIVAVAASNQHIFVFLVEERFLMECVLNADRTHEKSSFLVDMPIRYRFAFPILALDLNEHVDLWFRTFRGCLGLHANSSFTKHIE